MSTRATYCFWHEESSPNNQLAAWKTTFYIHTDGYYEGAAFYFLEMLEHLNKRGTWADRFHRANPNTEITKDHDWHSDTEYQYDLFTKKETLFVTAQELEWVFPRDKQVVKTSITLPIDAFITRYHHQCAQVSFPIRGTETQITLYRQFKDNLNYLLNFPTHTGNCSGTILNMTQLVGQGLQLPMNILVPLSELRETSIDDLTGEIVLKNAQAIANLIHPQNNIVKAK